MGASANDVRAGGAFVEIRAESSGVDKGIAGAQRKLAAFGKWAKTFGKSGEKAGGLGLIGTEAFDALQALAPKIGFVTQAASALQAGFGALAAGAGPVIAGIVGVTAVVGGLIAALSLSAKKSFEADQALSGIGAGVLDRGDKRRALFLAQAQRLQQLAAKKRAGGLNDAESAEGRGLAQTLRNEFGSAMAAWDPLLGLTVHDKLLTHITAQLRQQAILETEQALRIAQGNASLKDTKENLDAVARLEQRLADLRSGRGGITGEHDEGKAVEARMAATQRTMEQEAEAKRKAAEEQAEADREMFDELARQAEEAAQREQRRRDEKLAAEQQLADDIARLRIEATKTGLDKELALIGLQRDEALAEARRLGLDVAAVNEKFRLEEAVARAGEQVAAIRGPNVTVGRETTGTFSATRLSGLGVGGPLVRVAAASEQTARHTRKLADAAKPLVFQ